MYLDYLMIKIFTHSLDLEKGIRNKQQRYLSYIRGEREFAFNLLSYFERSFQIFHMLYCFGVCSVSYLTLGFMSICAHFLPGVVSEFSWIVFPVFKWFWKIISHHLQIFICPILCLSLSGILVTHMKTLWYSSAVCGWMLFSLFHQCSVCECFSLDNVYWSVFKFTNFFFCFVHFDDTSTEVFSSQILCNFHYQHFHFIIFDSFYLLIATHACFLLFCYILTLVTFFFLNFPSSESSLCLVLLGCLLTIFFLFCLSYEIFVTVKDKLYLCHKMGTLSVKSLVLVFLKHTKLMYYETKADIW